MGVLDTIERHVSVRDFLGSGVGEEDLRKIFEAARRAPSAWNMQSYHVVAVRSSEARRELARILGGQEHVAQAPVVLVVGRPASRPEVRRRQSPEAVYSIDVALGSEARGRGTAIPLRRESW